MPRSYYRLLAAFITSSTGDWIYNLALPLMVYNLTHSALSMALTFGLTHLPFVIFSPIGGVLADRFDCRRLLIAGDLMSAALVGSFAVLFFLQVDTLWLLYLMVFLLAGIPPLYHPVFQSFIPLLVGPKEQRLARANAWLHSSQQIITVLGPCLGGAFIGHLGMSAAFVLDALSFLASAGLLLMIRTGRSHAPSPVRERSSVRTDVGEGLRYVWQHPVLRHGSLVLAGANIGAVLLEANLMYFLKGILNFDLTEIGVAFASLGIGASLGALLTPWLLRHFPPSPLILGCTILSGFFTLPLLIAQSLLTVSLPLVAIGILDNIVPVVWFTLRQKIVPAHLLGRAVAFTRLIAFAPIPVVAVLGGAVLVSTQSMPLMITLAALCHVGVGGLGFLSSLQRNRQGSNGSPHGAPQAAGGLAAHYHEDISIG
jgi:predicted MFS family arabinose efflux permease